ncbi:Brp/Blh family beta-carotene 15,15'-dioxygenase [Aureimonas phyllosphaerae]|uniref:Brp/Blh family beta-carotene 15,15'-dioxygenase n=1 Tax=Aureimonas phyllosphaerae TaxID=1166078 RepID=UPI003A5C6E38
MTLVADKPVASGPVGAAAGPAVSGRLVAAAGFAALALAADGARGSAPLAFAAVLILAVGLPHGASDHLLALRGEPLRPQLGRLAWFLAAYLGAAGAMLAFWQASPGVALAAFLLLSAAHFAIDDVDARSWRNRVVERFARGLMPITLPALLHEDALAQLFGLLSTPQDGITLARLAGWLAPLILLAAVGAAFSRVRHRDREGAAEIALGAMALIVFSPLVGFALVFALIHSHGETRERMQRLGLPTLSSYLRACAPTLLGAAVFFAGLALWLSQSPAPALGSIFIGLAALTVPHMLVTPLFTRDGTAGGASPQRR